jgi:hypothetical protein
LERGDAGKPFTESEALALRVVADQIARRLDDLHRNDRWFGARWAVAASARSPRNCPTNTALTEPLAD